MGKGQGAKGRVNCKSKRNRVNGSSKGASLGRSSSSIVRVEDKTKSNSQSRSGKAGPGRWAVRAREVGDKFIGMNGFIAKLRRKNVPVTTIVTQSTPPHITYNFSGLYINRGITKQVKSLFWINSIV